LAGDRLAGDRLAGDRLAGDRLAGDRLAGDRLAGDRLAGDAPRARSESEKLSLYNTLPYKPTLSYFHLQKFQHLRFLQKPTHSIQLPSHHGSINKTHENEELKS